ncbi:MAG: 6-bladed beta-propeller, partial [Thermodesulfovibrionales bacterium]|nr:6-bladed beta-propeller [Thermodesulfovibrionales bacterium]
VDAEGNIYIADEDKKMVHVLDGSGRPKLSWGGKTKQQGWEMKKPAGIYVYGDRVYVTDRGMDAVHIFLKDGKYIESFGEGGGGPKKFSSPAGICVVRGVVYVADTGNKRVQAFSIDGIYMGSVGGKNVFKGPIDVAVDYRGYLLVADEGAIKLFKPSGELEATYYAMKEPVSISVDKSGFYATDNKELNIKKFDFMGNQLLSFGTEGKGSAQFREISGLSVGPSGGIFIADAKKKTVQVFSVKQDPVRVEDVPSLTSVRWLKDINTKADRLLSGGEGKFYGTESKTGSIFVMEGDNIKTFKPQAKGGWKKPGGMAIDPDGLLWLADTGNDRIIRIDSSGNITAAIGSSGSKGGYFSDPSDIDISEGGLIYVADTGNERVQVINRDGVFLRSIGETSGQYHMEKPVAVALDSSGSAYIADAETNKIFVFTPEGKSRGHWGGEGDGQGLFKEPSDILVTETEVFVLDSGNRRVQVFDLTGRFLREFGAGGRGKGDFKEPSGFALTDATHLLISDPDAGRIQMFNILYTPKTPGGFRAEGGMRQAVVSWQGSDEGFIDHYTVYRSEDRLQFREIASVAANATAYSDSDILPERKYYYKVSASAVGGNESGLSNVAEVVATKFIPSAPAWFSTTPGERSVAFTWEASPKGFVTSYAVYREEAGEFKPIGTPTANSFIDGSVNPDTAYTYRIVAVSSDGIESDAAVARVATLKQTKPPVELAVLSVEKVFSNNYKYYEKEPLGTVKITNNTAEQIARLKLSLMVKEYMDYPTEKEIENLQPWQSLVIPVYAVFNNKVLDITENTTIQAELKVSYYDSSKLQSHAISSPLTLYEKHHTTWDVRDRIATFITPKDPILLEFARGIAKQYTDDGSEPLFYARAVFGALGVIGVSYMPDPNTPYQVSSERSDVADYIQYPRETLFRKSGDCDDLVNLYASALESLGVDTVLLDMPGHILMMFSTKMDKDLVQSSEALKDMFVMHEGYAWVPVETTLVGSSFINAWKKGVESYNAGKDKGLQIIDIKKAWETFKPATLPPSTWRAEAVYRDEIEAKFRDELAYLKDLRVRYLSKKYLDALYINPSDLYALLQLGIVYVDNNNEKAAEFFRKILAIEPGNAAAMNNLGNLQFIKGGYAEALKFYEDSAARDPKDPEVFINIAKCYLKLGEKVKAKDAFERAYTLNPDVAGAHRNIAFEVGDPSLIIK